MRPLVKNSLYFSLVSLGFASFATEILFAKFYYDSGRNGLDSLGQSLFDISPIDSLSQVISGSSAALNLLACLVLISPIDSAKRLMFTKKPLATERVKPGFWAHLRHALVRFSVISNMLMYYSIISAANWLGMYDWIKENPFINYSLGGFIVITGIAYNILVSGNDISRSTSHYQGLDWSLSGTLWRLSPHTYLVAVSKFLVAAIYKSAISGYVCESIFSTIFDLPEHQKWGYGVGFVSCFLVLALTRYPSTLMTYLQPYLDESGEVNAARLSATLKQAKQDFDDNFLSFMKIFIRCVSRYFGCIALLFGLAINNLPDYLSGNALSITVLVILFISAALGSALWKSLESVDTRTAIAEQAAKLLANVDSNSQGNAKKLSHQFLADVINIGSLISSALLASHSMIHLFSNYIGTRCAAVLALAISLESVWVSFFYYQDKYYEALIAYQAGIKSLLTCQSVCKRNNAQLEHSKPLLGVELAELPKMPNYGAVATLSRLNTNGVAPDHNGQSFGI